jgi:hypothetical protein
LGTARAFATADRFFSEIRAVTNLFSNLFAIVVVARWMGELGDERLRLVLDDDPERQCRTSGRTAASAQGAGPTGSHPAGYRGLASRVGGASR